jgi:drug/metabolite transporter (DMT)-like permease
MQLVSPSGQQVRAIFQALLVTFLWSTSWVLIKFGLRAELPALTFAGIRYVLAFFILAPFVIVNPKHRASLRAIKPKEWVSLSCLGIVYYTLTQGAQFLSLAYLPTATVNLLLNLTPFAVAAMSAPVLHERLTVLQWIGMLACFIGVGIYFYPAQFPGHELFGISVALLGVIANAVSSLLGRWVNQQTDFTPLVVTFTSMGVGAALLIIGGVIFEGIGRLGITQWTIIAWLAIVNTAYAFTLWNKTLQTLTATESSVINSTMLPQIAILAWIFLGESLGWKQIVGLVLVITGTITVQVRSVSRRG